MSFGAPRLWIPVAVSSAGSCVPWYTSPVSPRPSFRTGLLAIIAESACLAAVFSAIAGTSVAFVHATVGLPVIVPPPLAEPAAAAAALHQAGPVALTRARERRSAPLRASYVFLDVPFTAQAPSGDWSEPYAEACEEAAVTMAMAWVRNRTLTPAEANAAILDLVAYEDYVFGHSSDTALRETAGLFTRYHRYANAAVIYDVTVDDMKTELAKGNILIVPVAGRLLGNPSYLLPPPYHMVVVQGFDDLTGEFITNDPGTRRGKNYRYPQPVLWNAIHDWTGSDATVALGRKGMLVVAPPAERQER